MYAINFLCSLSFRISFQPTPWTVTQLSIHLCWLLRSFSSNYWSVLQNRDLPPLHQSRVSLSFFTAKRNKERFFYLCFIFLFLERRRIGSLQQSKQTSLFFSTFLLCFRPLRNALLTYFSLHILLRFVLLGIIIILIMERTRVWYFLHIRLCLGKIQFACLVLLYIS